MTQLGHNAHPNGNRALDYVTYRACATDQHEDGKAPLHPSQASPVRLSQTTVALRYVFRSRHRYRMIGTFPLTINVFPFCLTPILTAEDTRNTQAAPLLPPGPL